MVIEIKRNDPPLAWIRSGPLTGEAEELWVGHVCVASYWRSENGLYFGSFELPGIEPKDGWLRADKKPDELKTKLENLTKSWFELTSRPIKGEGEWWAAYEKDSDDGN